MSHFAAFQTCDKLNILVGVVQGFRFLLMGLRAMPVNPTVKSQYCQHTGIHFTCPTVLQIS
jgi:hypothetical protein